MKAFFLDQDPWIPAMMVDGSYKELSLVQAFEGAEGVRRLVGTPPCVAATMRFLLAIAHLTRTPSKLEEWASLYRDRRGFLADCAQYVRQRREHWNLFDPDRPFGQVPGLEGTVNPAHLMLYEAARKNNPVLTDHSLETSPRPIPPARIPAAMLAMQAFGGSSGGGYTMGPLAMRTVAFLEGENLAETLLLNLLVLERPPEEFDWGQYGRKAQERVKVRNPVDLYLWTSRQVSLVVSECGDVRQVRLAPGNTLPQDLIGLDPMVVQTVTEKNKKKEKVPLRLQADVALWRNAHVLLGSVREVRLKAVDQLSRCVGREFVDDRPVSLRVCALAGDAQGPRTELWRDERIEFEPELLQEKNRMRLQEVEQAVHDAEKVASRTRKRLAGFASRYLAADQAARVEPSDVRALVEEIAPNLMDYWGAIASEGERLPMACLEADPEWRDKWARTLREASLAAFDKAVERLPPSARRLRAQFGGKQ